MFWSRTGRREDLSDASRPAQRQCHPTGARTPTGSNRLGWTRSGMTWEQEYSRSIHARAWLRHATWNSIRILPGTAGWMGINGGSSCGQHTERLCLFRCGTMCEFCTCKENKALAYEANPLNGLGCCGRHCIACFIDVQAVWGYAILHWKAVIGIAMDEW